MPALKNTKHERFAQALAKGKSADEAYQAAGYKPNRGNAARLKANESIRARISELQKRGARRVEVTVESLTMELEEARQIALTEKQSSAAVAATMGKAKLFGHGVENRRLSGAVGHVDLTNLSEDQLAALEDIFGPLAGPGDDDAGDPGGEGAQGRTG